MVDAYDPGKVEESYGLYVNPLFGANSFNLTPLLKPTTVSPTWNGILLVFASSVEFFTTSRIFGVQ